MTPMNIWRSQSHIRIDNACLLLAGIDPWEVDPDCPTLALDDALWGPFASIRWAYEREVRQKEQLVSATAWLGRLKRAVIKGEIQPSDEEDKGLIRVWKRLSEPQEDTIANDIDVTGKQIGITTSTIFYELIAYDLVDSIDFDVLASSEGDFDFDFDVSRSELARWLLSLGWSEVELPDFLSGADTSELSSVLVYGGQ